MSDDANQQGILAGLLLEALGDYADHQAWRCHHPSRYDLSYDCECGLHEWKRKVIRAIGEKPCSACSGSGTKPVPMADGDGWIACDACKGQCFPA